MTTLSPAQAQQAVPYSPGTGRRKTAVAQVKLMPGTGKITVNDKAVKDYFPRETHEILVTQPLRTTNVLNKYNVVVKVAGGGPSGQAGAVCMGIARALYRANPDFKALLRKGGYLTRDSRMRERKKPGLVRARRAKQYTKR
ncbi:MAG: 30S ribosomal protein S9 [Chloroflexota bacterium]|nr:30S ribosomal protein S9 [Chloroflexota bacterium]